MLVQGWIVSVRRICVSYHVSIIRMELAVGIDFFLCPDISSSEKSFYRGREDMGERYLRDLDIAMSSFTSSVFSSN
jgi:hypothetical protein